MELLFNGPKKSSLTIVLAHGAGAPMDTAFMTFFAEGLGNAGYRVARFEFPYMASRRTDGRKRPPDRQPVLLQSWQAVIEKLAPAPLVIGGKSMGGRMASLIAADPECPAHVRGLVCLGYPFYGAGRKDKPRTAHLATLSQPTLICQGTRDPMGDRDSVTALKLSHAIKVHWCEDGNHDLVPRKASGRTTEQNWQGALDAGIAFLARLAG
ncbi:MAG: alpha/beta fold hydrolase [Rhodospirillaceae bacterium]|nr:MAG: alpha/beta fold hydrolase [Rhodospirillaceae bacterium]